MTRTAEKAREAATADYLGAGPFYKEATRAADAASQVWTAAVDAALEEAIMRTPLDAAYLVRIRNKIVGSD